MKELIIMIVLFSILLIFQMYEMKSIEIPTYKSKFIIALYGVVAILILLLFKQDNGIDQMKLLIFAGLVFNFGVQKEGLSSDKFIKAGYIFSSDYKKYEMVEIEPIFGDKSKVKLKKNKDDNGISLVLDEAPQKIREFFEERTEELLIEIEE